eukprot:1953509-Alexandrium_andersonii.AAC.1
MAAHGALPVSLCLVPRALVGTRQPAFLFGNPQHKMNAARLLATASGMWTKCHGEGRELIRTDRFQRRTPLVEQSVSFVTHVCAGLPARLVHASTRRVLLEGS